MRPRLRVATWNLGESRLCNLPTVAATLRSIDADLVFLNEVMRGDGWADSRYGVNQVTDLQQRCGYAHAQWLDTAALAPHQGSGVKMVGVLSRFALSRPVPQPALEDPVWNGIYRALEVQADIDGRTWFLYTLRFSAYNFDNFSRHCALLRDRIVSLPPDTPVIAAGDFNGGAHHWKTWRDNGMLDPGVVLTLPAPLANLVAGAGLSNACAGLPLQPPQVERPADPASPVLPAHVAATDLILFRGPYECVQVHDAMVPCDCVDAFGSSRGPDHALTVADLAPAGTIAMLDAARLLLAERRKVRAPPKPRKPSVKSG